MVTPCSTSSHGLGEVYTVLNTQEGRCSNHAAQAVMAGRAVQGAEYTRGGGGRRTMQHMQSWPGS